MLDKDAPEELTDFTMAEYWPAETDEKVEVFEAEVFVSKTAPEELRSWTV